MKPAFSTIEQYLSFMKALHERRRATMFRPRRRELADLAEELTQAMGVVLDRISYDKALFARWAHNDSNQGKASRQNAYMRCHEVWGRYGTAATWETIKRNYIWSREHTV